MALFTVTDVHKTFQMGEVKEEILKGVSLTLYPGEMTALVGSSGSGKSTLLTIAAGLQSASEGSIIFNEHDLATMNEEQIRQVRASEFGFVFQFAHLVPFLTVEEQLFLMLDVAEVKWAKTKQQQHIDHILSLIGMEHRKNMYPASLSGGEKQRVAIARAIIHQPKVLFADEPTASLDSTRSKEIMELLQSITKELNIATLIVTHDEEMLPYVNRIVKMVDGIVQ
ncbi:ABC transporter ATP-binding protein [Metasolibacillus sp. FSL K6-0083]|uniref:ABC transporter ATP-binding protein n=1 Tax=Metasolibacillus sp. FSL K6-0083 TaxID=2921416 RepID=UPI0007929DF6|nr:hemin ABC transporter ATP-binding protein [[Bacillus] sp. KCTC 13219]